MDTSEGRPRSTGWWRFSLLLLAAILLPFAVAAGFLDGAFAQLQSWQPAAPVAFLVVVAALVADIVLPIPSSAVLVLAGLWLGWGWGALANAVGLTLSLLAGHGLGRLAARGAIRKVLGDAERLQLESAFARFGPMVVAVTRPVPVLAEAAAFLSGVAGWPQRQVWWWGGLANAGLGTVMAAAGAVSAKYGESGWAWAAVLGAPALAWLGWQAIKRRRS